MNAEGPTPLAHQPKRWYSYQTGVLAVQSDSWQTWGLSSSPNGTDTLKGAVAELVEGSQGNVVRSPPVIPAPEP